MKLYILINYYYYDWLFYVGGAARPRAHAAL